MSPSVLQDWQEWLREWWKQGGEVEVGDFDVAVEELRKAGLGGWAEGKGGLDDLGKAVRRGYGGGEAAEGAVER